MSQAPLGFVACVMIGGLIAWSAAKLLYQRQIETLKESVDHLQRKLEHSIKSQPGGSQQVKIERLSALIVEGQSIRERFSNADNRSWGEWSAWAAKTEDFLKKEAGPQALPKFKNMIGVPEYAVVSPFSQESSCPLLDRQIENLTTIMEHPEVYLAG